MLTPLSLALSLAVVPPPPDVVPSGIKLLQLQLAFDCGPGVPMLRRAHRPVRGETLADIAEARLGSRERVDELLALNPGIDPDELRPGDPIWLLPVSLPSVREGDAESAEAPVEWVRAYADVGWARQGPSPFPLGVDTVSGAVTRQGKLTLYLVPDAAFEEFEAARKARRNRDEASPIEALRDAGRIQILEAPISSAYVPEEDAAARRVDRYRIERDLESGEWKLTPVSSQRLDAEGKPVEDDANGQKKQAMALILLSTGGCTGLWFRRRRRGCCGEAHAFDSTGDLR